MHVYHPSQVTHRPDWARVGRFALQVFVLALILLVC
jgi:hypothetical protein